MPITLRKDTRINNSCSSIRLKGTLGLTSLSLIFMIILILPVNATAYVGPGAGITLIGALWAVIVAVVLMVGGLLMWPFRALLQRRKNARSKKLAQAGSDT